MFMLSLVTILNKSIESFRFVLYTSLAADNSSNRQDININLIPLLAFIWVFENTWDKELKEFTLWNFKIIPNWRVKLNSEASGSHKSLLAAFFFSCLNIFQKDL